MQIPQGKWTRNLADGVGISSGLHQGLHIMKTEFKVGQIVGVNDLADRRTVLKFAWYCLL